ncbi:unnamed protein product (macronuclear) [Paramecium tetraurelia]|uniref:Enkurin domain-containing protein n=1 Tax=Paramecium tetraurelia TaxID=5888 RepID=A0DU89_PARTE|nr:uncharacterized protein GSPATT00020278001 [Paramecium tetraurelia]CAK86606.1 unnamed protein product [Paramecium tetraurelia]|eukprot:XP_001454003.1 hypothetical protein (macronuclear) [Paramecium tetraurelia strain d4-2]
MHNAYQFPSLQPKNYLSYSRNWELLKQYLEQSIVSYHCKHVKFSNPGNPEYMTGTLNKQGKSNEKLAPLNWSNATSQIKYTNPRHKRGVNIQHRLVPIQRDYRAAFLQNKALNQQLFFIQFNMHSNNYKSNLKNDFNEYYSGQSNSTLPRFQLMKELCKGGEQMHEFIPFIRERDQMNRLVRINSEKHKLHTNTSRSPSNRNCTPDQFWQYNKNHIIPEKRKKMSFKFNYQIKIDHKTEAMLKLPSPKTERTLIYPPIETKKRGNNRLINPNLTARQSEEPRKQQMKIPLEILQPYINQEMEQMKQDLFFKVDQDYQFPSDLSEKLMQQKKHIENLRKRLREWGEMKTEEDIEDLKQHAKFILSKNS